MLKEYLQKRVDKQINKLLIHFKLVESINKYAKDTSKKITIKCDADVSLITYTFFALFFALFFVCEFRSNFFKKYLFSSMKLIY